MIVYDTSPGCQVNNYLLENLTLTLRLKLFWKYHLAVWVFGEQMSRLASAEGIGVHGSNLQLWQPGKMKCGQGKCIKTFKNISQPNKI